MEHFFNLFLAEAVAIFAILDPIGVSAMIPSLLHQNITKQEIKRVAFMATLTALIAFFVVLLSGDFILKLFGIDMNSLKAMGGVVLLLMAVNMVNGHSKKKSHHSKEEEDEAKEHENLAVIPIGIPIIFGPGLFATVIVYKSQAMSVGDVFSLVFAFLANAFVLYLTLRNSIYIKKVVGITGERIVTRLMGLITGAIAIQFMVSGVVEIAKKYI
ncbi:Multiple antibiotic resistance protein marC [hydrothermal vent metagenome]|uniref:Multiple antibiotic resistance protein marC n=1 Tax=hydrothermal vent metagenome TaxID=652676 RepID=A0A1W1C6X4_9ZZZZ